MKKKLIILTILAILLTFTSGFLVKKNTENTLTNLGPLDDPICIQSVITDKGFPIAWQKGVTRCSENDAHSEVGVFNKGGFSMVAFIIDTAVYLAIIVIPFRFIQTKNQKHSWKCLFLEGHGKRYCN